MSNPSTPHDITTMLAIHYMLSYGTHSMPNAASTNFLAPRSQTYQKC